MNNYFRALLGLTLKRLHTGFCLCTRYKLYRKSTTRRAPRSRRRRSLPRPPRPARCPRPPTRRPGAPRRSRS